MAFKEFGWDGISFETSKNFEVCGLDKKFIQLDNGNTPCVEIRWYDAGSKYKENNYFRELAKKVESASGLKIEPSVMPGSWKEPLKQFNSTAFYWQSDLLAGRGVIFYCKNTKTVVLVQFMGEYDDALDVAANKLFSSFKICKNDSSALWKVYDIKTELPSQFSLNSCSFKPGNFKLTLTDSNETISFYKFGPAKTILKNESLGTFSRTHFKNDIEEFKLSFAELEFNGGSTCMLGQVKKPSSIKTALAKINPKKRPFCLMEIHHTEDSNRIVAVCVKSRTELPEDRAKELIKKYEIIS